MPGLPAVYVEQDEEAQTLELYLEDPVAGMELVLLYTIYENMPVLTRSARFICRGQAGLPGAGHEPESGPAGSALPDG